MKPLVLLGGGGHCRACIEVIESAGRAILGILDKSNDFESCGYPCLGDDAWIDAESHAREYEFLITVGQIDSSAVRQRLFNLLSQGACGLATVSAASAIVSRHSTLGTGTIVMHQAVVNSHAKIGRNCIINTRALIEHDCTVGDHGHISTGAILNGGVRMGASCFVGSGAIISHGRTIADKAIIGAGAVVINDITEPGTWVGVPARRIR
jgi:sugar O-acyltransferase (sialic acid O-acetyltransferase NeuD family)